jgi:curved DNA-binding protein CbpA
MMRPQTTTLYDVLGLERDAPLNQIRAAFRKLAMQHHPDRFQGERRTLAEQRFQEITEAFNVLGRPDSREKYDREISLGGEGRAMDRSEIARRLASKGAQAFKEGRLAEALEELKMAIDHDDDCGRAHYFMGVTLARVSGREKDALRHVERALMLEPNNATIMAEAAQLALSVGLKSRARRFAEQAAALDPTNSKASEVLQKTGDENDDSTGEGLFSRFRRKG